MAKTKGRLTKNQYASKDDYGDLVKKAESATASLYPLRYRARNLREDIGEADDATSGLEKDILDYVEDIGNRIHEKREKLQLFRESVKIKVAEMEAAAKNRVRDIEEEREEMEKQRAQAQEKAQLLRVKLAELERNILLEANQKEKIIKLKDIAARAKTEHDKALQDMKTEFTRDLRKMRRDYEEKMNLTNDYARKILKPCITEIINNMRDANTGLAHYMRRISQEQGVLFKKISEIEGKTNYLRYEYELWKDVHTRKLFRCDPQLPKTRDCSSEQDTYTFVEPLPQVDAVSSVDKILKITPYQELKNTLRSLLGVKESSTGLDTSKEPEGQTTEGGSDEMENTEK